MPAPLTSAQRGHHPFDVDVMVSEIRELVRCESPSDDHDAVARSARLVDEIGARYLGRPAERIEIDGVTHLRWRFGTSPRVLIVAHHDTVWPIGSIRDHPAEVRDGLLTGPGCFDMKAGIVMAMHAIADLPSPDGITLFVSGDEEPGSKTSRPLIESEARTHAAALILEASAPGGALKTERKGVSRYRVRVHGRAAHAGLDPERGINATVEVANQVLAVDGLNAPALGTTVTVTRAEAGSASNTVPAVGEFSVDVRARTLTEQQRVHREIMALLPQLHGATLDISGGPTHPPLTRSSSAGLFARFRRIAARSGAEEVMGASVGGASDGNFTAGVGTPTLDGLGAVGGGAHADDEHVVVEELVPRTRLLAELLRELQHEKEATSGAHS